MEIFEEKENKKESNRSTRILLIINAIIWSIIILMAIFFGKVVNAATVQNANGYQLKNNEDTWSSLYANGSQHTSTLGTKQINIDYGNLSGSLSGTIYVELRNANINSCYQSDLRVLIYTGNSQNQNASYNISGCQITTDTLGKKVQMQIDWNAVAYSSQYYTVAILFNNLLNPISNITVTGTVTVEAETPASSNDIGNQTVSIINSIASNVQEAINNAISNKNDIGDIVNSATNTMQNAIINFMREQNQTCETYNYSNSPIGENDKILNADGTTGANSIYNVSKYIKVKANTEYKITLNYTSSARYCLYDKDKNYISCNSYNDQREINITPNNDGYIRYAMYKYGTLNFTGQYCESNTNVLINELWLQHQDQIESLSAVYTAVTPDTEDFEDLEEAETELHTYTNVDLDSFNVDLDTDTSSWVWNTLTSLLNTSALVFGMVISILSIGLIKLILNR